MMYWEANEDAAEDEPLSDIFGSPDDVLAGNDADAQPIIPVRTPANSTLLFTTDGQLLGVSSRRKLPMRKYRLLQAVTILGFIVLIGACVRVY
jgi:hypothetical protein